MENNIEKTAEKNKKKLANKVDRNEVDTLKLQVKDLESAAEALTAKMQGLTGVETKAIENKGLQIFKDKAKATIDAAKDGKKLKFETGIYETEASEIFKAAIVMTTAAPTLGTGVLQPLQNQTINALPRNKFNIFNFIKIISVPTTGNWNEYAWIEAATEDKGAAFVDENTQKPLGSTTYVSKKVPVHKIVEIIKCSTEFIQDAQFIWEDAKNQLTYRILDLLEKTVITGTGVVGFKGMTAYSQTLNYAAIQNSIADPTMFDVIMAAITQVREVGKGEPSVIVLNAADWFKMTTLVDANGNKLVSAFVSINAMGDITIGGVPVVTNTNMTAGSFEVADAGKYNIVYKQRMEEDQTNVNEDDWTFNRIAFKKEMRLTGFVMKNDENCFVSDTFANGITFLTVI